jgi:hypothetical protein
MNLKTSVITFFRNLTPVFLATFAVLTRVYAATVWNGPPISFSKASFADWNQPANQDRITPNVWITRGNSQGIFNVEAESFFVKGTSPADTEWATGDLANYATLSYTDWTTWAGHFPPGTVLQNAVVHLISDDIYLSLTFMSWVGAGAGGGFSYTRSTPGSGPPPPPPAPTLTSTAITADGTFSFTFTNTPGNTFSILATTNISLPLASWMVVGSVTDFPAGSGSYRFVDTGVATNWDQRHYVVRWP